MMKTDTNSQSLGGSTDNSNTSDSIVSFRVFPNPSSGTWTVQLPDKNAEAKICIYNCIGKQVGAIQNIHQQELNISATDFSLTNGIYIMVVYSNNKMYQQKLLLNH